MGIRGLIFGCAALVLVIGRASGAPADAHLDRLILQERYSEAFGESVSALKVGLREKGHRDPRTLAALYRVGMIAHLAGDQRTAEDVLGAVLVAQREVLPPNDPAIVETLITRGRAARYRNERVLARKCYDEAALELDVNLDAPRSLRGQLLQAEADYWRGLDLAKSIAAYRAALAIRRAGGGRADFAAVDNLTWLAWTLNRAGEREEAVRLAIQAKRQLEDLGLSSHSLRATLDNILADNLAIQGRLAEAAPLFRATAEIAERTRRKQPGGYSRRGFPLDGNEPLALDALSRGQWEEAWTVIQRGRAPSHVDFATLARWSRWDPVSWRAWQRTRSALKDAKRRLVTGEVRRPAWNGRSAALFVEMLELRGRGYELERRYLDAFRPRVPSLERVQALLGPKEALVGWVDANFGGELTPTTVPPRSQDWAYVLRRDRPIAWVRLWETRSAQEYRTLFDSSSNMLEMIRRAATWRRRVDPEPEFVRQMRDYTNKLITPLLADLEGIEHVVFEGRFEPYELSILPDGTAMGDRYDISYVPSALAFSLLAEEGPPRSRPPSILAISGPSEPAAVSVASLVNMDETSRSQRQLRSSYRREDTPLERLPRLRYAALEAEAVGEKFDRHVVLVDPKSADGALETLADRGRLSDFTVVHVAAHTLSDSAPERCAVALGDRSTNPDDADGLLEVEDIILGWQLNADLMTLSGCETLRAAGAGRGEPLGFTPALFASGARRVLSSMWTVDDRATTILMDRFYEDYTGRFDGERLGYRGAAMPAARALREAKIYVRTLTDAKGRRPFEHPAYWAGFLLVGLP